MLHARVLLVTFLAGSVAAAAACGTSGYQFVENEEFGVYAKVPDDWAMYDEDDLRAALIQLGQGGVPMERDMARTWFRGFDSSAEPSVIGVTLFAAPEPRGFVEITQLTRAEIEQVSVRSLRGFDSVAVLTGENPEVDLRVDEPAEFEGGYHGIHTVYASDQPGGIGVIDRTVVLDPTNTVMYTFMVGCNARCFDETHTDEIETIVESWTIQEDGS